MATDLEDLVEPLKRELAVPGEFDTYFPSTSKANLVGALMDAFAEAQLDGFFSTQVLDVDAATIEPNLSSGAGALVILYAGIRTLRASMRNAKTKEHYEASGSVYEIERSAQVLVEELKDFRARKNELLALIQRQARGLGSVFVTDGYLLRAHVMYPAIYDGTFGSFYNYEIAG